jgi:hypothetical protein
VVLVVLTIVIVGLIVADILKKKISGENKWYVLDKKSGFFNPCLRLKLVISLDHVVNVPKNMPELALWVEKIVPLIWYQPLLFWICQNAN